MKITFPTIAFIFVYTLANAQSKEVRTKYFDKDWKALSDSTHAAFYRTVEESENHFIVRDYYISGKIQMLAEVSEVSPEMIHDGKTTLFYENGNIEEEGFFTKNSRTGLYKSFYENGNRKKEILYGEKTIYHHYWSQQGKDFLISGTGFIEERSRSNDRKNFTEVIDSLAVSSFYVDTKTSDTVYIVAPQHPDYPGGMAAMTKDLSRHLVYPKSARRMGIDGKVFLEFRVDKDGRVKNVNVLKGISADCDQAAIHALLQGKNWTPGEHRGRPINFLFVLPVNFKFR